MLQALTNRVLCMEQDVGKASIRNSTKPCLVTAKDLRIMLVISKSVVNLEIVIPKQTMMQPLWESNRTARLNRELTAIRHEVIDNLESVHGALLRMNRSIQAEGTFGVIKWDRTYKRLFRRGEKAVILEFTLISCGFNLYKYHNKINRQTLAAW